MESNIKFRITKMPALLLPDRSSRSVTQQRDNSHKHNDPKSKMLGKYRSRYSITLKDLVLQLKYKRIKIDVQVIKLRAKNLFY
jgi:hypothetical protein